MTRETGSENPPYFADVIDDALLVGKGGWNRMRANLEPTKSHNGERRKSMERPSSAHMPKTLVVLVADRVVRRKN